MEKIPFDFDYWKELDKYIKDKYPNKIIFINDDKISFFDDEEIPVNPNVFSFENTNEFISFVENVNTKINIIQNLSVLWINGNRDTNLIYKLRG